MLLLMASISVKQITKKIGKSTLSSFVVKWGSFFSFGAKEIRGNSPHKSVELGGSVERPFNWRTLWRNPIENAQRKIVHFVKLMYCIWLYVTWHGMAWGRRRRRRLYPKNIWYICRIQFDFRQRKHFIYHFQVWCSRSQGDTWCECVRVCVCGVVWIYCMSMIDATFILSCHLSSIRSNVTMNMLFHLFECDASSLAHSILFFCSLTTSTITPELALSNRSALWIVELWLSLFPSSLSVFLFNDDDDDRLMFSKHTLRGCNTAATYHC